ncbi:hypothetical protein KVT40_003461 [Elsinoe batatas]|uniref:Uncharacterized protein n=1 Tax=Elsinoe batatas TaxID=2601811 RepID=A0A8K0PH29_9PEZI|nr:hypothetical protein KVT40_003461 [Elsinoe batatas]
MDRLMFRAKILKDGILGVLFCLIGGLLPAMRPTYRDLTGKTAIVTGSNSGIGYGFALQLAEMGATVILACRNEKKATKARDVMLEACPSAKVETLSLDTASLYSVTTFAQNWRNGPIDILAHNAGVSLVPDGKELTEDGYEYEYQVNFLSSFLLTHLLERHFSKDARVIFTSSIGSYFGGIPNGFEVAQTKGKVGRCVPYPDTGVLNLRPAGTCAEQRSLF